MKYFFVFSYIIQIRKAHAINACKICSDMQECILSVRQRYGLLSRPYSWTNQRGRDGGRGGGPDNCFKSSSRQNLSSGFPTKRDSYQSPQLQRLARKLKLRS